jgi:P27 family predicted phage terminase small subunit
MYNMNDKTPPQELNIEGQKEWNRVIELLGEKGFLEDLDRQALMAYCDAVSEYIELMKRCNKMPPMIKTTKGNWVQNPVLSAKRAARDALLKASKDFGLTPWARSRMDVLEKEDMDEFSQFIKKQKKA